MGAEGAEFNELIHGLRGRELERLHAGAGCVLSGGCPDATYFRWFAEHYPTPVDRHLAVELFREAPHDLPAGAEHVHGNLGDLAPIPDESVDLVFAGQVIEHLWADDLAGFLTHAHRVLRPGGRLAVDSPNRLVTMATGWHMPEHTLELSPSEARELLALAGFDVAEMRGLWLCAEPRTGEPLGLHPDPRSVTWPVDRRAAEAAEAPDSSFIWWANAVRADRAPAVDALRSRVVDLFESKRPEYFAKLMHTIAGVGVVDDGRPLFVCDPGSPGALLIGPYVALPPGRWSAVFTFESYRPDDASKLRPGTNVGVLDIVSGEAQMEIARREIRVEELPRSGERVRLALDFELPGTTFAGQTRVHSSGAAPLAVAHAVDILPAPAPSIARARSAPLRLQSTRRIRAERRVRALARRLLRRTASQP